MPKSPATSFWCGRATFDNWQPGSTRISFLGNRSFNKIMAIVRQEMDRIGQEFFLPALHPRELWEASGRFWL
jgi:prolyl-tRNA synthetase